MAFRDTSNRLAEMQRSSFFC
ncbi:hypothetical protein NA901_21265 [Escherichia coli]|nr:hypothetical protein [Escherichia coli]MEB7015283.1 hypothetical protein [Escherichia coli]MEB7037255.1 hypothetical protein [Escherichia coli]